MLPNILVAISAIIFLLPGLLHIVLLVSPKLKPSNPAAEATLRKIKVNITNETDLWHLWIGFNGSHALSLIFFGSVYAYLALAQGGLLFHSQFLAIAGGLFLFGYLLLAKAYWFSQPFIGVLLAVSFYLAGFVAYFV